MDLRWLCMWWFCRSTVLPLNQKKFASVKNVCSLLSSDSNVLWELRCIHPLAFKGVLALKFLTIKSHQLQQLPPLQDITHSLISLHIVSVKIRQTKTEDYFIGCWSLERLVIPFSALEIVSLGLQHVAKTVEYLHFKHNVIRSIASMEGITFSTLLMLDLRHNNITHLNPENLITPQLRLLDLEHNHLVSLRDVTQYSWGNSLPNGVFLSIYLKENPRNCDGLLTWLQNILHILVQGGKRELIYAKSPLKPMIRKVGHLICHSPDRRFGTVVVPRKQIAVHRRIKSLEILSAKISRCDTISKCDNEFLSLQ